MQDQHGKEMDDIVFIASLKAKTVIGIYAWERKIRQEVVADIEMKTNIRAASASDDINNTLNYKEISKRVQLFIEESQFKLIETLAERMAMLILSECGARHVRIKLTKKGAVRGAEGVGVVIERTI